MKCLCYDDLMDVDFSKYTPTDILAYNIPIYIKYTIDTERMEIRGIEEYDELPKVCVYKWKEVFDEIYRLGANLYKNDLYKNQDKNIKKINIIYNWVKTYGFLFIPKNKEIFSNEELEVICEIIENIYIIFVILNYLKDVDPRARIDNSFDIYPLLCKIGIVENNKTLTSEKYVDKVIEFIYKYENKYQKYLRCFYDTDIYYSSTGTFRFVTYSTSLIAIAWKKMKLQISSLKIFSDDENKYIDVRICQDCLNVFSASSPKQLRCNNCQVNKYGYDIKDVKNYNKLLKNQQYLKCMWFCCTNQDELHYEIRDRIEYLIELDASTLKKNSNVKELEELQEKLK